MSFSLSTIGHAAAADLTKFSHLIEGAETVIAHFAGNKEVQAVVSTVATVLFGATGAEVSRGVFAIAGEFAAALKDADAATTQKFIDLGLDAQVISDFKALIAKVPNLKVASSV